MVTPQIASKIGYEFCKDNPELTAFIVGCCMGRVIVGVAGAYFSGGTCTAATIPLMTACCILYTQPPPLF